MITAKTFTIIITTKDRLNELMVTLDHIKPWLEDPDVSCIICDDGSADGTADFIRQHYPEIKLMRNERSRGLIYSRNLMMAACTSDYAISLDDDLHLLTPDALKQISTFFDAHDDAAVLSFRIYWNIMAPSRTESILVPEIVSSFAGGAHAWRMKAWHDIKGYPDWFIFYGEERHAAMQLFQAGWNCYFLPTVLAHHRVDLKGRKKGPDYRLRLRRSVRSGWYLYVLFLPWKEIPRRLAYTGWHQLKTKVFKGDLKALLALLQALGDLLINLPKLIGNRTPFSSSEWKEFNTLKTVKLYWNPDEDS